MKKIMTLILILSALVALYFVSNHRGRNNSVQGYVEVNNLYLASPYAGTLIERPVSRGDVIQKGDLVFKLDPNPEALTYKEANHMAEQEKNMLIDLKKPKREPEQKVALAQIEQVKAQLGLAKLRMKRYEKLYKLKAGNLDEADAAVQHFNETKALAKQRQEELTISKLGARQDVIFAQISKIQAAEAKTAYFKWQMEQKTLHAPETGILFDTYYSEGEWVPAGKPVASLFAPRHVFIEFFVTTKRVSKLSIGQIIQVTSPGSKDKQKAVIEYISPEAEYVPPLVYSQSNYDKLVFRVKAKPKKPGLFKPGQPVIVSGF